MRPRKRYTFWIDARQATGLDVIRRRDGILPSEQIRRALEAWLVERQGVPTLERKRAGTRKRP